MNDCLVTKLKGTVQNDSLPILNTIRIDLLEAVGNERLGNTETLLIATGDSPVVINSAVPFHVGSSSTQAVTNYTLAGNTLQNLVFVKTEMPTTYIANAVTISGGIYDLQALVYYLNVGWLNIKDNDSLKYASGLVSQVCTPSENAWDTSKIIAINDKDAGNNTVSYPSVFTKPMTNIKMIWGLNMDGNGTKPMVGNNTIDNIPNVEHLIMRYNGTILNLPLSIKALYVTSSLTTGSLEEFVADRRSRGKTSGVIAFYTPQYTWVVTYQGTAIKDLDTTTRPIIDNYSYFVWDASTMGFASSVPEGFKVYSSLFGATQDAINGVL